jgi:cytoskeletal protein CcmA (bactofilin family)
MTNRLADQSGSVLATVLIVLIILLSIFLSAMTYALSRYSVHMANQNRLVASHLSDAGVTHTLAMLEDSGFNPETQQWLAPNGGEIKTDLDAWGPYILVRSFGKYGNQTVQTNTLVGSSRLSFQSAAVTVCDESNPLVVAGRTRIIGDVHTGTQGIMEGRFRGEGVTHKNYHIGMNYQHRLLEPPELDTTVLNQYKRGQRKRRRQVDNRLAGSVLIGPDDSDFLDSHTIVRVENNLLLHDAVLHGKTGITSIFVDGSVEINGHSRLSGFIEIVAEKSITVGDSAIIDNIILWARDSIVISDAARFSALAICEGKIIVKNHASLVYPSLLLADTPEGPTEPGGGIYLRSRGRLESVCYLREKPFQSWSSERMLYLDTVSYFQGMLISEGQIDLRGRVDGSTITERFHFDHPPTTYINWLKDAYINRTRLNFMPVLPVLTTDADSTAGYFIMRQDKVI